MTSLVKVPSACICYELDSRCERTYRMLGSNQLVSSAKNSEILTVDILEEVDYNSIPLWDWDQSMCLASEGSQVWNVAFLG